MPHTYKRKTDRASTPLVDISLKAVTTAKENGVVMLTLTPIATIGQNSLWTTENLLLQSNGRFGCAHILVEPYRITRSQNL